MATQPISGERAQSSLEADDPPEYHTINPNRALIECIRTPSAPLPPSGSSQAFKVNGVIYVAAQIGALPRGDLVIGQTASFEQIFLNIEAILKAAGSSLDRIIKTTVYFAEYVRGKYKFEAHYKRMLPFAPPRTTVIVQNIRAEGGTDIQMEVIAVE
ncbi:hypothetical protein N7517_009360 [Penicillium concentricum]|uniref:YjgF-like protein n=1 Tax=Penicillium concentricum TaxID=293559 RepID=A0A9W9RJT8_9EURO|nr:uncharacterized protein N7517_009360 [Penicillium concentricum]KAJ5360169.1 hypothetical protein N7517_009360 [Penicillium concentricum]